MLADKKGLQMLANKKFLCLALCLIWVCFWAGDRPAQARTVRDMRGKNIKVPEDIRRVATIDDGFVEGLMTHLGVIDKVAVIGSWSMKRDYKYDFSSVSGETYRHQGWNTMKFLHPWLDEKICINSPQGNILDFEALAKAAPDVVILRLGDCTVGAGNKDAAEKTIATLEAIGFPLIVLHSPNWSKNAQLASLRDEAQVLDELFGRPGQAAKLMDWLASTESLIRQRTKDIPAQEKARVLYLGLNPNIRQQGGAGSSYGLDTPESYIIESVAGAVNAFAGKGFNVPLSAEQIYALDPDVIILPTNNGYHPPRELYDAPYFTSLNELRAVKNKRIYAMPWSPMNCSRRVEYPLDMLIVAKAAYPERFKDIKVHEYALELYKKAYNVDDTTARDLRSTQLLDWMLGIDF